MADDNQAPSGARRMNAMLEPPEPRRSSSKSAVRALDVLEYFAHVKRPLRATDLAKALGMHPSSTDQLLKTMVDSAYLLTDSVAKVYYPSPRLVRFANWLTESYYGKAKLAQLIETIARESQEIVTLAAAQRGWLQIVDVAEPVTYVGVIRKGSRVPMFSSALGEAYLAALGDAEILRWLDRTPEARRLPQARRDELLDALRAVRTDGYACSISDHADLFSIAVALPRTAAGLQLVLGLAGPQERIEPRRKQLFEMIRRAMSDALRPS